MIKRAVKTFFKSEISIGITLLISAILALLAANSPAFPLYQNFLKTSFLNFTIHHFINDTLMALFFLLVGLELKKEILGGELASKDKIILPAVAAFGGIIIPALIFILFNLNNPQNLRGFAIPTATDIAFAYGMISLFGKRISNSLKIFLVALAVLDDMVAILIIAFFYSQNLDFTYLALAFLIMALLAFVNFKNSDKISIYLILGIFLWMFLLKSGIHASLSGVILALFIPNKNLLPTLAHKISPAVNFLILPLFAFANAGVRIEELSLEIFTEPLVLGIIFGLFFGKQIGVMLFSYLAVKFKITNLPKGASWLEFWGVAIFTGIGFTMSLFIGALAFDDNDAVKIGVLAGSFLSAVFGFLVLKYVHRS